MHKHAIVKGNSSKQSNFICLLHQGVDDVVYVGEMGRGEAAATVQVLLDAGHFPVITI